jgi:polysaccharide export outer membrane protein
MHLLRGRIVSLIASTSLFSLAQGAQTATPPPAPPATVQQLSTSSSGAQQAPAEQPAVPTNSPNNNDGSQPRLHLGGGDLIDIAIFGVPDLSSKGRISNEGEFYMPLIGYSKLAGLNVEEAQALIEKKYIDGGFVKNPHVTINVLEYVTQGASLLGEIAKPGIYPVLGSRRLYDIISAAGGFTPSSGRTVTITHRASPQTPVVVVFADTADKATEANVEVFPGDTIVVAKAQAVYVVGEVGRPSGILMDNKGMTVLKALALGGGPGQRAKLDASKILRRNSDGTTEEIPVPLKQILSAKSKDINMQAEDILFVPGRSVMAIQTILQLATGMALRAPF